MPYLSIAKRGFVSKFGLVEMVNTILHKLKTSCQWEYLPVEHLCSGESPAIRPSSIIIGNGANLGNGRKCLPP